MNATIKNLLSACALVLLSAMPLTGCDQEGPAERAGESIDRAVDDAGDALEDAADDVEDAADR